MERRQARLALRAPRKPGGLEVAAQGSAVAAPLSTKSAHGLAITAASASASGVVPCSAAASAGAGAASRPARRPLAKQVHPVVAPDMPISRAARRACRESYSNGLARCRAALARRGGSDGRWPRSGCWSWRTSSPSSGGLSRRAATPSRRSSARRTSLSPTRRPVRASGSRFVVASDRSTSSITRTRTRRGAASTPAPNAAGGVTVQTA
jgi:hypothetical protein